RRRGTRSIDGGPRTNRAGLPCPWVRRTRISCPPPAKACVGVRGPARRESASRPSLSRGAVGAQPPTPAATRSGVCSSRDVHSRVPCHYPCLLPFYFSFVFWNRP